MKPFFIIIICTRFATTVNLSLRGGFSSVELRYTPSAVYFRETSHFILRTHDTVYADTVLYYTNAHRHSHWFTVTLSYSTNTLTYSINTPLHSYCYFTSSRSLLLLIVRLSVHHLSSTWLSLVRP